MAHATVYRQLRRVRRSPVPRVARHPVGLHTPFGKLLARLSLASETLERSRPRRG